MQKELKSLGVHVPGPRWTAHRRAMRPRRTSRLRPSLRSSSQPGSMRSSPWEPVARSGRRPCTPIRAPTIRRGSPRASPASRAAVLGSSISPQYLQNVLTSSPVPSNYQIWHTPAVQQCDRVVRKAYPTLKITPPTNPLVGSDQSFYAVESACINLALFTTIAKAAGKNLTWSSFARAGYAAEGRGHPRIGHTCVIRHRVGPTQLGRCTWSPMTQPRTCCSSRTPRRRSDAAGEGSSPAGRSCPGPGRAR